jgi:thioredoxin-related protein
MRLLPISLLAAAVLLATAPAAEAGWTVGWKQASAAAATAHRPILADFTGSDWCSWCMRLKREVFDTPEFAAWAKDSAVLLEVDFPEQKSIPAAQQQENQELAERYGVRGFPTVMILAADGSVLGRLGYMPGGAPAWIAAAERIIAQGAKR